jgi:hypothetical protein
VLALSRSKQRNSSPRRSTANSMKAARLAAEKLQQEALARQKAQQQKLQQALARHSSEGAGMGGGGGSSMGGIPGVSCCCGWCHRLATTSHPRSIMHEVHACKSCRCLEAASSVQKPQHAKRS